MKLILKFEVVEVTAEVIVRSHNNMTEVLSTKIKYLSLKFFIILGSVSILNERLSIMTCPRPTWSPLVPLKYRFLSGTR